MLIPAYTPTGRNINFIKLKKKDQAETDSVVKKINIEHHYLLLLVFFGKETRNKEKKIDFVGKFINKTTKMYLFFLKKKQTEIIIII